MEPSLIFEILENFAIVAASITSTYAFFCWWFVWDIRFSPRRLGDIGWKRVDYIWIIAGATSLVFQFIQIGLDSRLTTLRIEKSLGQFYAQSLNIAADELSKSSICTPKSPNTDINFEFSETCRTFNAVRPADPRSTIVDMNIVKNFETVYAEADKKSNPLISQEVAQFKQAFSVYEEQVQTIQRIGYLAKRHEQYLFILKISTAILLVIAVSLRLAKVTGEIRLKTHPIEKKSADSISPEELTIAISGLVKSTQLDELREQLNSIEHSSKLKQNIMFALISILAAAIISALIFFNFR